VVGAGSAGLLELPAQRLPDATAAVGIHDGILGDAIEPVDQALLVAEVRGGSDSAQQAVLQDVLGRLRIVDPRSDVAEKLATCVEQAPFDTPVTLLARRRPTFP
jgi:hypothetical protein